MTTSVAQPTMTPSPRPTLSQQILELSADARLPDDVRVRLRHASHRAKRQADELETARVQLHNLDYTDCPRCGEWYGIGALTDEGWCKECLAAAMEEAEVARREDLRERREVRA